MKHAALILLISFLTLSTFSQRTFEKGYFIGNDGSRTECYIMIPVWSRTPSEFLYKIRDTSEVQTAGPGDVSEFGTGEEKRYISVLVKIDVSSEDENNPSTTPYPEMVEQRVFLQELLDGEASLYEYDQKIMKRYFYKTKSRQVEQLVYKIYRLNEDQQGVVRTNSMYKQQLWANVHYEGQDIKGLEKVKYEKADLVSYFKEYCIQSQTPFIVRKRKKEWPGFNLGITPGFNCSFFNVVNTYNDMQVFDFPAQPGFRLGIETELVIPYTHRSVSLFCEPTFQYYYGSATSVNQELSVRINTIEFPIGARYHAYFKKGFRGFADLLYDPALMVMMNSTITFDGVDYSPEYRSCIALGGGFGWKRLGVELRWYTKKSMFHSRYLESKYTRLSVIVNFRLVQTK